MTIDFDPAAPHGQQFTIDGIRLSRLDAAAILRTAGLSIREADERLAAAKLRASSPVAQVKAP